MSQDPRSDKPKPLMGYIDKILDLERGPYLRIEGVGLIDMSLLPHDRKWYEHHKGRCVKIQYYWKGPEGTPGGTPLVDIILVDPEKSQNL